MITSDILSQVSAGLVSAALDYDAPVFAESSSDTPYGELSATEILADRGLFDKAVATLAPSVVPLVRDYFEEHADAAAAFKTEYGETWEEVGAQIYLHHIGMDSDLVIPAPTQKRPDVYGVSSVTHGLSITVTVLGEDYVFFL